MKARCWLWILLTGQMFVGLEGYGQCTSVIADYQQLRKSTNLEPAQAINYAIRLQTRWRSCRQPIDSMFIGLLFLTGDLFLAHDNNKASVQQYQLASKIAASDKAFDELLIQSNYLLGTAYLRDNRNELAKAAFSVAVKGTTIRGVKKWGVLSELNLAYLSYLQGDYQQALVYADAGKEWALNLHNDALLAKLLCEKVNALYELGQYEEAANIAYEMIRLATTAHEVNIGSYYLLLGDIESARGNITPAVKAYQTAAVYYKSTKNLARQAFVLTNLGFLYYSEGNYSRAVLYNQQALALQKNAFSRARLFDNLAACWWKMGQFDKALITYQQGLITMPIDFKALATSQNPTPQTIRLVSQKEYLLTLIQDKADTWLDYAKATGGNRQRLQYALDTYTVADQMIDYMRWEHTGQQSKLFWRNKTRGMYERVIETCFRLGDADQAFRFMEKSRAVMLADKLNELGARQKLSRQQIEQEQQLQQAVSSQQSKLADIKPSDSTAYNSTRMALLSKQDSLSRFLKNLEATNPAYYQYKYNNKTATLADLQRYLKKQPGSLVTYFVGDSALYVLGVTGDAAMLRKQPVAGYKQTLNQFAQLLASPEAMSKTTDVARFRMLSNNLYRQLLAPLSLPEGRVVVSPDGFFVPFDALSRSAIQFDFAVNHYAFSYVYSASLLLKNGSMHARTPGYGRESFLGVAPVEFAPMLKQVMLPNSDATLNTIADRFDSPTLLTHKAATRRNFLTEATTARIIHLFTHATADSTDQEPTLYFADSTLQLSDFSDNALPNAQLVVLAACKTGIGANQRGEGVFSLARGFAALGVPSVLTTLWSVQNDATYKLTDLFYKYIDEGLSKDIALQRAKQDWLKNAEGANQLPNFWAGLIVVGDAEPLPRINIVLWGSVLLALLIAASLIIWHERPKRRAIRPVSLPQPV